MAPKKFEFIRTFFHYSRENDNSTCLISKNDENVKANSKKLEPEKNKELQCSKKLQVSKF